MKLAPRSPPVFGEPVSKISIENPDFFYQRSTAPRKMALPGNAAKNAAAGRDPGTPSLGAFVVGVSQSQDSAKTKSSFLDLLSHDRRNSAVNNRLTECS